MKAHLKTVSNSSPAVDELVVQIPIGQLVTAPWNARKTFDVRAIGELVESIKAHGIQVPLLVRVYRKPFYVTSTQGLPDDKVFYLACKNVVGRENLLETFSHGLPAENRKAAEAAVAKKNGPGDYEIVAGHRRFEAAKLLKLDTVPCIMRELTDDQAREIGLVDNLQREDVPAMEEADAYNELKQRLGTPAAIAARVGKDVSYVARRLQLVSLAESPRRALQEKLITIDHALLLARLGVAEQDVNLKWALNTNAGIKEKVEGVIAQRIKERARKDRYSPWEPQSPLELKHHIEQNVGRKLSRAPWDLDDAALVPAAGACTVCPSNTKHNDTLFGDMNIAAATCENGGCFEAKRAAFVQIRLSEATAKQDAGRGPAVRLSWKVTSVKPRFSEAKAGAVMVDESGVNLMQTFKRGQWREAKPKSCQFVRNGVTVDWSDANDRGYMGAGEKLHKPGQLVAVCIAPGCKAHRKEWEKPKGESGAARETEAERQEKEERMRLAALAETKLRARLAGAAVDKVTKLPEQLLRRFLIDQLPNGDVRKLYEVICPGLEKTVRTAALDSVAFAKAVAALSIEGNHLEVWRHWPATQYRKEFVSDLKLIGYDASKVWDKAAEPKAAKPASAKPAAKPAKKAAKKKGGRR